MYQYIPIEGLVKEFGHQFEEVRHKVVGAGIPRYGDGPRVLLLQLGMFLLQLYILLPQQV